MKTLLLLIASFNFHNFDQEPNKPVLVKPNRPILVKPNKPILVKPNKPLVGWKDMVIGVKSFEDFRSTPYVCCGGKRTIGYGHIGKAANKRFISKKEATELLELELTATKEIVLSTVKVPLNEHQLAALTSFTFNCGRGALYSLVSQKGRLNDGNYNSIKQIMPLYRKAGGKVRKGLVRRRSWELALWNNSVEHAKYLK